MVIGVDDLQLQILVRFPLEGTADDDRVVIAVDVVEDVVYDVFQDAKGYEAGDFANDGYLEGSLGVESGPDDGSSGEGAGGYGSVDGIAE